MLILKYSLSFSLIVYNMVSKCREISEIVVNYWLTWLNKSLGKFMYWISLFSIGFVSVNVTNAYLLLSGICMSLWQKKMAELWFQTKAKCPLVCDFVVNIFFFFFTTSFQTVTYQEFPFVSWLWRLIPFAN